MGTEHYPTRKQDILSHPDGGLLEGQRQAEIADRPLVTGGGGGTLTWAAVDLTSQANGHLSAYTSSPPEYASDGNFVYLRGGVKYVSGFSPTTDNVVIPASSPLVLRQLPYILVDEGAGTIREGTSPQVGVTGTDAFLAIPYFQGGATRSTFGIFWLDGLSYSITT